MFKETPTSLGYFLANPMVLVGFSMAVILQSPGTTEVPSAFNFSEQGLMAPSMLEGHTPVMFA